HAASDLHCCLFFTHPPTPHLYTLSLHDALPISPLSAYAGDIITIKGRGLTSMGFEVFIAENQCKVVSYNANEIKFMAPALQRKGKYPVELIFFYNFSRIKSTELLELK